MEHIITLNPLPETLEEMKQMKEANLLDPYETAALTVAALNVYPKNKEESIRMLDYLRGPRPLSPLEKQFINDRFMDGKDYLARSYMGGSSPDNNYTPASPVTVRMKDSSAPIAEEGYKIVDLYSSGADSTRSVTLRLKPSENKWYLWEQNLLAGIRVPKAQDPWA